MTIEYVEKEIDFEEAKASQDEIVKEQRKNGILQASDEEISRAEKELAEEARKPHGGVNQGVVPKGVDTSSIDQLAEEKPEPEPDKKSPQEILEELGLKEEPKERILTYKGEDQKYVQKPLTFLGKIQFLSYVGEVLDKAMTGDNALQLNSLFEIPGVRTDSLSAQDFSDAQTFIQAVGKLLAYAPDFLEKSYCIWLGIPEYERPWAIAAMNDSMSDEDGIDIIETFIDQNWSTLQSFFSERLPKLRDRLSARYQNTQSEQSKR